MSATITLTLTLDNRFRNDVKYFKTRAGVAIAMIRRKCQPQRRTVYFAWHSMSAGHAPGFYSEGAAIRYIALRLTGRRS